MRVRGNERQRYAAIRNVKGPVRVPDRCVTLRKVASGTIRWTIRQPAEGSSPVRSSAWLRQRWRSRSTSQQRRDVGRLSCTLRKSSQHGAESVAHRNELSRSAARAPFRRDKPPAVPACTQRLAETRSDAYLLFRGLPFLTMASRIDLALSAVAFFCAAVLAPARLNAGVAFAV
jgi:hypothetical protein